ncbi:adenylosuccinate lyase family protein [Kaustia mangrovi]|uniref:Adenylosuccinate lyase family protein n=1 Tax=Kaustia mangrovi TaxID=2593653 RepID=A0A7S8HCZ8_9HYPH|nr:adenylosuccinate lyase family protein [Kaustia mangrovi]QPC43783.1 adenylosuccinate lyase family protein [Kaustia mangrovi]
MAHIIDHEFYKDSWGTPEMRAVFDDRARFERWLDIEATLAEIQAGLGIVPEEAAREIRAKARFACIDEDRMREDLGSTGHTLMALLNGLERACEKPHGEWIHYGPTTQDIQDTGAVLEMRDAWAILVRDLKRLEAACLALAERHAATPMVGRTHGQHGLPMTLGMKIAGWAAELRRDIERMKDIPSRAFFVMLHGGVGTQASFGAAAEETTKRFAAHYGLFVPPTCWANARDGMAEYQTVLGIVAGTLGRIANEVFELSRTEVSELHEPTPKTMVGSTTMPHKRNAVRSEFTGAMVKVVMNNTLLGLQGMIVEHERDTRVWRLDWHSLPESSLMLHKALAHMIAVVEGLDVDEARIAANLDMLGGAIMSEAVMFHLGTRLGKQTAHHVLHEATMEAAETGRPFREAVLGHPALQGVIAAEELEGLMDYSQYLGTAEAQVHAVIAESRKRAETDPEV